MKAFNPMRALPTEIGKCCASVILAIWLGTSPAMAQPSLEIGQEASEAISARVKAGEYGAVSSLWIEQNGEVLFYEHYRDTDESSYHNMRSVGKTVTGMLLGAALDDGLVSGTDLHASNFFDELKPFAHPDPRKNAMTLEHLLTMSGSLECDDFNSFSRGNEERMYVVEDWSSFFWNLPVKNRPSWEVPENNGRFDRYFSYCTAGAQLVGEIVQRVTQRPFAEYAQERLFDPIGLANPKWNYASNGNAHLGGGLELTTTDWARLARLMVNGGVYDGEQVLSKNWVDASFSSYVQTQPGTDYGYLLWRPAYEVGGEEYRANMMSGTGGNRVYMLPEFGIVMVITKNDYRARDAHDKSDTLFETEIASRLQ